MALPDVLPAVLPECLSLQWWQDGPGRLEPKAATNVQNWPCPGYVGPAEVFSPHRGFFVCLFLT